MTGGPLSALSIKLPRFAFGRACRWLLLLGALCSSSGLAQHRPVLQSARRDYFAGKFVLLPLDTRPASFQLPRLIAHIADHEIIAPPYSLLGNQNQAADAERIIAWAKQVDYGDAEGVIVSLDLIAYGGARSSRVPDAEAETARKRLELITWLHTERPGLPIYGFITAAEPSPASSENGSENSRLSPINQMALDLVTAGALDYLLIQHDEEKQLASKREQLIAEINARKLADRVLVHEKMDGVAMALIARHLNRRFGFTPKILTFFSSAPSSAVATSDLLAPASPLSRITALIKAMGGQMLPANNEFARRADLVLFVHTPHTNEQKLPTLAAEIAGAIATNHPAALLDVSDESASRERMMSALRSRKLCDQLSAYAASRLDEHGPAVALAQASARLITARFLRDDQDRMERAEHAQTEMLFQRAVSDWAYDLRVRPKLETLAREQLKADPHHLGASADRLEEAARRELQPLAEELFGDQFRHNRHSILMSDGARLEFEVRLIQRFRLRLPWERIDEVELQTGIYLVPFPPTSPLRSVEWVLQMSRSLDARLMNRLEVGLWPTFDAGTTLVELSLNIANQSPEAENYAIRSRRGSNRVRRIEVTAPSVRGAFYALTKLEQLGVEGKLREDFQLSESPTFKQRGLIEGFSGVPWSQRDRLDVLRFMGRVRMNRYYYAPPDDPLRLERWRTSYTENEQERFKETIRVARENFVDFVYAFSPASSISYASEEDFSALTHRLTSLAALGVRHFALFFDEAQLEKPEDRARFSSLAAAQADFTNRVWQYLQRTLPGSSLTIKPAVGKKLSDSRDYLKELGTTLTKEIQILLPEDSSIAPSEWNELIGRAPIILGNFPAHEVEPWRLSLGPQPSASLGTNGEAAGFVVKAMSQAHVSMLPLTTSAIYAWDTRSYDPDRALNFALQLLCDERSRAGLRVWLETYRHAAREDNIFKPLFQQPRGEVNTSLIQQRLNELQTALESIGTKRECGLLRGELASFIKLTQMALEQAKNNGK